ATKPQKLCKARRLTGHPDHQTKCQALQLLISKATTPATQKHFPLTSGNGSRRKALRSAITLPHLAA
ncbi:unnamed protein product, partial [Ceratitis capitata]